MPARPVGISVSAGAKPGAGAAPHPSNTEGSRERLLHVPPSLSRARKFFFPPHCPGEAQQVQGEGRRIRSPSHCPPAPNPREFSKRSVSQESLSPQAPAPRIRPCPPLSPGRTQTPPLLNQAVPSVPQRPTRGPVSRATSQRTGGGRARSLPRRTQTQAVGLRWKELGATGPRGIRADSTRDQELGKRGEQD